MGNKGYRKYLNVDKDSVRIDTAKLKSEACFDGKWVLTTNTELSPSDFTGRQNKKGIPSSGINPKAVGIFTF